MLQSNIGLKGFLTINLIGEDGKIKDTRQVDNLVVTAGKTFVASRMAGTASAVMSHMAIGTSSTAASVSDTTLPSEVARVSLTSTTPSSNNVVYVGTFAAGTPSSSAAVVGAALFNASSAGTMLCSTRFSVINKGTSDSLTVSWTVTAS